MATNNDRSGNEITSQTEDIKLTPMHLEEIEEFANSEEKISLWQALRKWPKVSGYCLALTTGVLLWGYDMAMPGNLAGMDQFKEDFGLFYEEEWIIQSKWQSLWNLSSPVGMVFGALLTGFLQDRLGRRFALGLGSIFSAAGVGIVYASAFGSTLDSRAGTFAAGKIIQGLTVGIVVASAQTYMSEVLLSVLRGPVIAFFPIFFLLGQLMSALIVMAREGIPGRSSYLVCIISMWPFSAVPALVALLMPESPAHLVRKGRLEAALKAQRRLDKASEDSVANVRQLQVSILHEQKKATSDRSRYIDCLKATDLRRTLIACFAAVMPQLFGLPILGDGPYFLQIAGVDDDTSLIFLVSGIVVAIIATIISMWLLTVIGRRKLILFTLAPLVALWLGMGIAGCFDSVIVGYYVGVTTNVVIFTAALGVWPTSFVVTAEVSSLRLRSKTQGIAWAANAVANLVFSAVTPYIYNADAGNLRSKIGFVWFGIAGLALVGAWFWVPEMLGRTPLQLDLLFENKVQARQFSRSSVDDLARMETHSEMENV